VIKIQRSQIVDQLVWERVAWSQKEISDFTAPFVLLTFKVLFVQYTSYRLFVSLALIPMERNLNAL